MNNELFLAQIILTGILVVITGIYVWRTHIISKATQRQAEASTKMAEEMREQRYAEAMPLLVPDITKSSAGSQKFEYNEVDYQTLQKGVGLQAIWHNLGKGAAIKLQFSFWSAPLDSNHDKVLYFPPNMPPSFLGIGLPKKIEIVEKWRGQCRDKPETHKPRLVAEYRDIYQRRITTVQEFSVVEESGNKRAFIGELYFTVDGKRLGEKITSRD